MNDVIINEWTVGEYTIQELKPWGGSSYPQWFRFVIDGRVGDECYTSLDMALIEAIAYKHLQTGPQAGGLGTGSAGYWFARMIGMNAGE